MSVIIQDTIKRLQHLTLKDGDVLAIEYREPVAFDVLDRLSKVIKERIGARVLVMLVENMGEIRTLDEGAMRAHGWVRASKE